MKIIDYSNAVLGRAASKTAKLLLNNETVVVVNAEKAVVRGTEGGVMEKFKRRYGWRAKGNPTTHGPHQSRMPDKLVLSTIKHMLPYKQGRGKEALERLTIYMGLPKKLETKAAEKWAEIQNTEKKKFMTIQQISEKLGLKKGE